MYHLERATHLYEFRILRIIESYFIKMEPEARVLVEWMRIPIFLFKNELQSLGPIGKMLGELFFFWYRLSTW